MDTVRTSRPHPYRTVTAMNPPRHHLSPAAALLAMVFALAASAAFAQNTFSTTNTAWQTYSDKEHHFQISYPPGSHFTAKAKDYIRIQNFAPSDNVEVMLKKGEYYLEVHLIERTTGTCRDQFERSRRITVGRTKALIGFAPIDGDSGGIPFMFCAVRNDHRFLAVATENDVLGKIAYRILRSIKFSE